MQSVPSRIRTRVTVSISYDDNHYTMDTFMCNYLLLLGELLNSYSELLTRVADSISYDYNRFTKINSLCYKEN